MSATLTNIETLEFLPAFLSETESSNFFSILSGNLAWSEETIKMYGKPAKVPRLVCWYGDDGIEYRYSGVNHVALPWTPELLQIKNQIEQQTRQRFNSVLGNYYRNESDSMGWHSDNEKELGETPCIASVSLGEERVFKIRNKKTGENLDILLTNGSLLVMSGDFQNLWQHCLPKVKSHKGPRINLTYRFVHSR